MAAMLIGIDFDNTLVSYEQVFRTLARKLGLIGSEFGGGKQAIRDAIRLLPEGELAWQKLQGQVYGKGIADAAMFEGVDRFLIRCRRDGVPVAIVSHKTEFGHFDVDRVDLREAARRWMQAQGFFRTDRYAIAPGNVYFEATRQEKLARIARLGCSHFIDDLEEVLDDPGFPPGVMRVLFNQEGGRRPAAYPACRTWRQVEECIFRDR